MLARHSMLIALFAGGASATGFAPLNLWPVTLLALALWIHLLMQAESWRRTLLIGWLFGIGHFIVGLNWIARAFTFQSDMPHWLGWVSVGLLSLYIGFYPGLAALGARLITGRNRARVALFALALAGCWIVAEWVRSWAFSGFVWNPLSAVLLAEPLTLLAGSTRLIGTYGASAILLLLAGLLLGLAYRQWRAAAALFLPLIAAGLAGFATGTAPTCAPSDCSSHDITIVQPNIGQHEKEAIGFEERNLRKLADLTRALPDQNDPRLIFWPEAAILDYLETGYPNRYYYGRSAEQVRALLNQLMAPDDILLLGALALEFDKGRVGEGGESRRAIGARNSIMALTGDGRLLQRYDKAHLVPYGEYLPARDLLEGIGLSALATGPFDFWEGPGPRSIALGPFGKMGGQVCYEIIFSGQVVESGNRPDFIFNPSNDAWFGSWGPPQHLAQARLRAIEEGLPVIRATPTGISAVVDANGAVRQSLPLGKAGRIDTKLPPPHPPTLFSRLGNRLPLILAMLFIISAIAFGRSRR